MCVPAVGQQLHAGGFHGRRGDGGLGAGAPCGYTHTYACICRPLDLSGEAHTGSCCRVVSGAGVNGLCLSTACMPTFQRAQGGYAAYAAASLSAALSRFHLRGPLRKR